MFTGAELEGGRADAPSIRAALMGVVLCAAALPAAATAPAPNELRVEVGNVRSASGRVRVQICTEAEFLHECAHSGSAPAHTGTTEVVVAGLAPGRYAAQVYFDENGNGKLDRAIFGIPREGVAFSNDAPIRLTAPSFAAAAFEVTGRPQSIGLRLRYFMGAGATR